MRHTPEMDTEITAILKCFYLYEILSEYAEVF